MTIKSRDHIAPEEMYLLMRALFRDLIEEFLEKAKAGEVRHNDYEDDETKKHEQGHIPDKTGRSYFRFFQGAKSGSYEFFSQGTISLDYGVCIHGAYISFSYAD